MATALVPAHLSADVEKTDPEVLKGAFAATAKLIESGESRLAIIDRMVASGIPNPVAVWAYSQVRDHGPELDLQFEKLAVYDLLDPEKLRERRRKMRNLGWLKYVGGVLLVVVAIFSGTAALSIPIGVVGLLLHLWGLADIADGGGYPRYWAAFAIFLPSILLALVFTLAPKPIRS